jgi:S-phase kinase-associated protein 1
MSEEDTIAVSCPGDNGDEEFTMSRFAAMRCSVLRSQIEMMDDEGLEMGIIPLQNIDASIMSTIIEYLEEPSQDHQNGELTDFELAWLPEDTEELAPLILAANFLDCQEMMDTLTWRTAHLMKGKTPEELREMFNTPDDIPEEKKKEIHEQNKFLIEN